MAKIGVLGGSFHPFHNGHLMLGQFCLDQKLVEEIWFIPTGISYLKKDLPMLSGEERLHLIQLAIQDHPNMRALDIEIKRTGNTYTYETLEELHQSHPEHEFYFLIGADCLFTIETWVHPERIFQASGILAAKRDGCPKQLMRKKIRELKETYGANIQLIDFPEMDISSTDIRRRIHEGLSIQGLVPLSEAEEILRRGYFRE